MRQFPSPPLIASSTLLPLLASSHNDELLLAMEESELEDRWNEIRKANSNLPVIGKAGHDYKEDIDADAEDDDADNLEESDGDEFEQETALQESACDDNSGRLEMIRLYNGMCGVIESNTPDALHAYFGNSSAASNLSKNLQQLEIIYEDVHRILTVSSQSSAMESSEVKLAEGSELRNGSLPSTHQSESKLRRTSETDNIHAEVKVETIHFSNTSMCEESTNSQTSATPSSSTNTNDKKKAGDIGDESSNR